MRAGTILFLPLVRIWTRAIVFELRPFAKLEVKVIHWYDYVLLCSAGYDLWQHPEVVFWNM